MEVPCVLLQWRKSKHCYFIKTIYSSEYLSLGCKWPMPSKHHFLHMQSELALAQQEFRFKRQIFPKSRVARADPQSTLCLLLPTYRNDPKHTEINVWLPTHLTGLLDHGFSLPRSGNCLIQTALVLAQSTHLCHVDIQLIPYIQFNGEIATDGQWTEWFSGTGFLSYTTLARAEAL